MAVVRWLRTRPRSLPKLTRSFVYKHNLNAGYLMILHAETIRCDEQG